MTDCLPTFQITAPNILNFLQSYVSVQLRKLKRWTLPVSQKMIRNSCDNPFDEFILNTVAYYFQRAGMSTECPHFFIECGRIATRNASETNGCVLVTACQTPSVMQFHCVDEPTWLIDSMLRWLDLAPHRIHLQPGKVIIVPKGYAFEIQGDAKIVLVQEIKK